MTYRIHRKFDGGESGYVGTQKDILEDLKDLGSKYLEISITKD